MQFVCFTGRLAQFLLVQRVSFFYVYNVPEPVSCDFIPCFIILQFLMANLAFARNQKCETLYAIPCRARKFVDCNVMRCMMQSNVWHEWRATIWALLGFLTKCNVCNARNFPSVSWISKEFDELESGDGWSGRFYVHTQYSSASPKWQWNCNVIETYLDVLKYHCKTISLSLTELQAHGIHGTRHRNRIGEVTWRRWKMGAAVNGNRIRMFLNNNNHGMASEYNVLTLFQSVCCLRQHTFGEGMVERRWKRGGEVIRQTTK